MYANPAHHPQDPCWSLYRQTMRGSLGPWDANDAGHSGTLPNAARERDIVSSAGPKVLTMLALLSRHSPSSSLYDDRRSSQHNSDCYHLVLTHMPRHSRNATVSSSNNRAGNLRKAPNSGMNNAIKACRAPLNEHVEDTS